jgi:hypothetical protein
MSYRLCCLLAAACLLASRQHNLYVLLCVQCWTPDDGQGNCPKHVELYSKNKFEKLAHLVCFIIKIYHDARSSECQIPHYVFITKPLERTTHISPVSRPATIEESRILNDYEQQSVFSVVVLCPRSSWRHWQLVYTIIERDCPLVCVMF